VETVCVQWPRLGPYHVARLRAAHDLFAERGVRLVALETAEADETYGWRTHTEAEDFAWERVFAGRSHETIGAREMEAGVRAALDRLDPAAVAITSYSHPDARACLAWCRRHRRTAVLMSSTKVDDAPRVAWREAVKRVIVGQYDAAVVSGSRQEAYLRRLGFPADLIFRPVGVVDNARFAQGADAARAAPARFAHLPGLAEGTPFFLTVNRFVARKNLPRLLEAYGAYRSAAVAAQRDPWRLIMLGDGPEEPSLRAQAEPIGGVTFTGFRQVEDLVAYYGLAGALVHPALMDQWGLVVNEAMAAGLPVIVSSAAGCAGDLVQPGVNGYVFEPTDPGALARLLGTVASLSPDARSDMAAAGRRVIARYRPEDFAIALRDALEAGSRRRDRSLSLPAAAVLGALNRLARDARAFHSIPD
jgi:glycosyltransferase involved in cell wall biosynthesis